MPRHSKERAPWRHVKYQRNRVVRTKQLSLHRMRHFRSKSSAFVVVITFRKTASRSFRYLPLSLQNGVLRNQRDSGVQALPTIKPDPITVQMVLLMTRLCYAAALSQRQQIPAQNVEEVNHTYKFIQVSATVRGLTGPEVFFPCSDAICDHNSDRTKWCSCHFKNLSLMLDCTVGPKYAGRCVSWLLC